MTKEEIQKFIKKNKERHLSNKVLHAHPSPAQWQTNFSKEKVNNNLMTSDGEKTLVNMYVGIPYCLPTDPPHCGFCLFPTEKYNGKKDTSDYLEYVAKEADLYKEFYKNSVIESLYVGGGTPNLLAPKDYYRLMKIVTDLFPKMDSDYDWEKVEVFENKKNVSENYLYENNLRDFLPTNKSSQTSCMGGLGFAAINMRMQPLGSKTSSISAMNHKSLHKYYDDVLAGNLPIERAFIHESEDVKLVWLFQALQEMKIDTIKYQKIFNSAITEDFKEIWIALEKESWIEIKEDEITLVREGEFYVPLIQSLISKSQVDIISKKQAEQKEPV